MSIKERCAWIYGDNYLVNNALTALKEAVGKSPEGFTVYGDEIEADSLKGAMLSPPFDYDSIKLIVVRGVPKDHADIAPHIGKIPKNNYLAIISDKENANLNLYKAVKKYGRVVSCLPPKDHSGMTKWVKEQFSDHKKSISDDLANLVIEICGNDLSTLTNEIKKISLFASERKISEGEILKASSQGGSGDVWLMLRAIENRNYHEAQLRWKELAMKAGDDDTITVPNLIAWKLRMILMARSMMDRDCDRREIVDAIQSLKKTTKSTSAKNYDIIIDGVPHVQKSMYTPYAVSQVLGSNSLKLYNTDELLDMYGDILQLIIKFKQYSNSEYRQRDMDMFLINHIRQNRTLDNE